MKMKMQVALGRVFLALLLAALILYASTLVPHFAESAKDMRRFTHTPRGFAILMGTVLLFAVVSNFIFVDVWNWLEARRRRKGTRPV
jgi:hypothetical protein